MEKKKLIIGGVVVGIILLLIGGYVVFTYEGNKIMETETEDHNESITESDTDQTEVPETRESAIETETEKENAAIKFKIDSLLGFLTAEQLTDLQERVGTLIPEQDEKTPVVKCMTYQEVSTEDMNVTFYLYDNLDNVYKGHYSFKTLAIEVEKSSLSKADIEKLEQDEQAKIAESESKAQEEAIKRLESERVAESEKAEKEKKKQDKKKKKENETQGAASAT